MYVRRYSMYEQEQELRLEISAESGASLKVRFMCVHRTEWHLARIREADVVVC